MEKKLFLIAVLCLCLINWKVNAQSKDIEAKYEISYNVELVSVSLNNNYKFFVIDNYEFEVSTTTNNIEIVVIKASGDANNYAKKFSGSNDNYYLIIYQNGEKINTSNVSIKINSTSKVLNVYKNNGKLLEKSNEKISLTANDYFFAVTDIIDIGENNYIITDNGNKVDNVDDIKINDDSVIEIYNSKDIVVTPLEISEILNRKPGSYIKEIISDLEKQVIYKNIENTKEDLTKYIISKYN